MKLKYTVIIALFVIFNNFIIIYIFIKGQLLSKVNRIKEKGKSVEDIFFILLHTPNTHPPWCCNEMFLNISGKN